MSTLLSWLIAGMKVLVQIIVITWTTLAIYFSNLPWLGLRLGLAVAFAAFAIWAFWLSRQRRMPAVVIALVLGIVAWWLTIAPSGDRNWRPEVAVMPRAFIEGDHVRITGVRNFDYRSRNDFSVHYEEREVDLSHLTGLDFFVSYWSEGPVAHTFVSFVFDNAAPLSISIETRPEVGRGFEPIASMFKQFELIYVVGARSVTSWVYAPFAAGRRCTFISSIVHWQTRGGCCLSIWRESTNSPIGRNFTIC